MKYKSTHHYCQAPSFVFKSTLVFDWTIQVQKLPNYHQSKQTQYTYIRTSASTAYKYINMNVFAHSVITQFARNSVKSSYRTLSTTLRAMAPIKASFIPYLIYIWTLAIKFFHENYVISVLFFYSKFSFEFLENNTCNCVFLGRWQTPTNWSLWRFSRK